MIPLSEQQIILLRIAKEKGFIKLDEAKQIYHNQRYTLETLKRLIALGYLKNTSFGRFEYTGRNLNNRKNLKKST